MLRVCIPTIRSFDTLQRCIASLHDSDTLPDEICIIDNSAGKLPKLDSDITLRIHTPVKNLGCAASWNYFMRTFDDSDNIISNDDVRFHRNTLSEMLNEGKLGAGLVYPNVGQESMFSLFLLRRWAYREVGPFDENFYPAYFEDNDYFRRMLLLRIPYHSCDAGYDHEVSSTLRLATPYERYIHEVRFRANESYYTAKWGGPPHHEQFDRPFNA